MNDTITHIVEFDDLYSADEATRDRVFRTARGMVQLGALQTISMLGDPPTVLMFQLPDDETEEPWAR